ncbi:conserved hypothetical protein [Vibrio chagasii]|nr:conserved hypothetical protein [Vibrio chagasii]CAH7226206.1 conserved hypothetical protein [Vibrio chagasii]CAH7414106.1 conserved hypothetical protein [Vibrio chagasii]
MISISVINSSLNSALNSTMIEPTYRVFKGQSLDYRACTLIPKLWGDCDQPPHEHLREIVGEGYCLAINELSKWSLLLTREINALLLESKILARYKNPDLKDVYIFISTSENWTPFGVHRDFEDSIIVDIDGSGRCIYEWPNENDVEFDFPIIDARSFMGITFDYVDKLPFAQCVRLKNGEYHNVKSKVLHIFKSNGPGLFIGLSCVESCDGNVFIPPIYDPNLKANIKVLCYAKVALSSFKLEGDYIETQYGRIKLLDEEKNRLLSKKFKFSKPVVLRELISSKIDSNLAEKMIKIGAVYVF